METKLTKILEKFSIVFIIILIIESIMKYAFFPLIFIYTPIAVIALLAFFVVSIKAYLNSFSDDDNVKYKSYLNLINLGIFTSEIILLAVLHIVVCSCGHFMLNPVPVICAFIFNISIYYKNIKKEILEKKQTGNKIIFYVILFLITIFISAVLGKVLYSHPSLNIVVE